MTTTTTITDADHCKYTSELACTTSVSGLSSFKATDNLVVTVTKITNATLTSWVATSTAAIDATGVAKAQAGATETANVGGQMRVHDGMLWMFAGGLWALP